MVIPFHQYQRYKMTEIIINCIRQNCESFKILEVGANEHKNLEKFLPNDSIIYLDLEIPTKYLNEANYVKGDATRMDFEDSSFDFIIALDVLEHVKPDRRFKFFLELERVSRLGFIVSAPFDGVGVEESEKRISDYFDALYDEEIIWHKEHEANGFPNFLTFSNFIKEKLKLNITSISHGSIYIWEKFMRMEFMAGNNNKMAKYWEDVNNYYNETIFERDFSDKSVRSFIVASRNDAYIDKINKKISQVKGNLDISHYNKIDYFEKTIDDLSILLETKKSIPIADNHFVQLFIDTGYGYDEEHSIINKLKLGGKNSFIESTFDLSGFDNISSMRIDPLNDQCYIKVRDIAITDFTGNEYPVNNFITNADIYESESYFFFTNDPMIAINDLNCSLKSIKISMDIIGYGYNIDSNILKILNDEKNEKSNLENELNNYIKENTEIKSRLAVHEESLKALTKANELISKEILSIVDSKSWKLTKPLRFILDKINIKK